MSLSLVNRLIAGSYAKTIEPPQWNTFNPTSGGRRSFPAVTSYASPTSLDTPGWTWPAGGPVSCPGYQLQVRYRCDRLEGINGVFTNHHYDLDIGGGSAVQTLQNVPASQTDFTTPWADITNAKTGAVHFHDWCDSHEGGTAYVGNVRFYYRYVRS